jgi:hypothetical protein
MIILNHKFKQKLLARESIRTDAAVQLTRMLPLLTEPILSNLVNVSMASYEYPDRECLKLAGLIAPFCSKDIQG